MAGEDEVIESVAELGLGSACDVAVPPFGLMWRIVKFITDKSPPSSSSHSEESDQRPVRNVQRATVRINDNIYGGGIQDRWI